MIWQLSFATLMVLGGGILAFQPSGRAAAVALAGMMLGWGLLIGVDGAAQSVAGIAAGVVFALTEGPREAARRRPAPAGEPTAPLFRLVATLMALFLALGLSTTLPLPQGNAQTTITFAWYFIACLALILLLLGRDLETAGYGLVLISLAGPSFYVVVATEQGSTVGVLGAATTIALSLALARLRNAETEQVAGGAK